MVPARAAKPSSSAVDAISDAREDRFDFPRAGVRLGHFDRDVVAQRGVWTGQPFVGEIGVAEGFFRFLGDADEPPDSIGFGRLERLVLGEAAAKCALRNDAIDLLGAKHATVDQFLHAPRCNAAHDFVVDERMLLFAKPACSLPSALRF
jgi:hypothetical protein